ncbi:MAG: glycine oxidase ThiO [Acidobacteriaceae bacterium]|nr:glycine oxidase ThiO [Acidobacteriaceae bacterium]
MSSGGPVPQEFSVAVVGGGIIGLSIAWRLAQSGWTVAIFDKCAAGGEASWAGAGMLAPGGEFEEVSRLTELAIESRREYQPFVRELEAESDTAIDFGECGALDLAFSGEELKALDERARGQSAIGIHSKALELSQVYAFWPRIRRDTLAGARFYPDDAVVNPRDVVYALKIACRKRGVRIAEHCGVQRLAISENSVTIETEEGSAEYRAVVVAAGAWSSQLAVGGVPDLPSARPVKGQLIGYRQPAGTCATIVRHGSFYFLQRANGLMIAGASVEHSGFNREIRPTITEQLAKQAGLVFPHLDETTPSEVWVGFRPGGEELQIRSWHSPRLYLAYGHYRNGILLAPVTAKVITTELNANLQRP